MNNLWRLAYAAAIVAFAAAVLGSWVRINGAGMSCPDVPLCNGSAFPSLANGVLWEWSHRLLVLMESAFVGALILAAYRAGVQQPIRNATYFVGGLFGLQVLLGAATVHLSNSPISVVMHWGTAMAFLASLVTLATCARSAAGPAPRREGGPHDRILLVALASTSLIAFATMCIGAYVSSSGAGLACQSIPGCAGNVVAYGSGQYVQMLHRFIAASCLFAAAASFALSWRASQRVRWLTGLGLMLLFAQVLLGVANVAFSLPMALREAHAANAAATFIVFVIATTFAALERQAMELRVAVR